MKVQIEKKDLLNILARAQNIVERRNTMPVLVNVLLEAETDQLKIFATNLEVSLTDSVQASVTTPGRAVVNAKSLFDIVKELPEGMVDLEKSENNWLNITKEKSVFNIVGISPEEYPVFPTFSTSEFMEIDADMFKEMIEKTIFSVSTDETRYHLNGVKFEKAENGEFRMVATDGHRLSLVDRAAKDGEIAYSDDGVIIPRKGLYEIRKLLEAVEGSFQMAIEGSQLIVRNGEALLMIRLIEGRYPTYQKIIPNDLSEHAEMERDTLLASLKRVSLLSNQKSKGVTFALSPNKMEISSNNPELGDAKEELEINYKGKELKISFNAKYILDVLNSIHDQEVAMDLKDPLSAGMFRPKNDPNYTCVIMPMRI